MRKILSTGYFMKNKTRIICIIIFILIFVATEFCVIQIAKAEVFRAPGVGAGDWIKYGNFSVISMELGLGYLGNFEDDLNRTDWMLITVQEVSESNITYEVDWHFKNGSDRIFPDWIDVNSGVNPNSILGFPFLISKSLQASDSLYNVADGPYLGWKINKTMSLEYLGAYGDTHHIDLIPSIIGVEHHYNIYWDKQSGVLTEYTHSATIIAPPFPTTEVHFEIIDSHPTWPIPEFSTSTLLSPFIIATLLAVMIYRRKRYVE